MSRIVGIDLGTTNSLVAYMDGNTPRVIRGRRDRAMVPSVVALTDNNLIVGDAATCRARIEETRARLGLRLPVVDASGLPAGRARELLEGLAPAASG